MNSSKCAVCRQSCDSGRIIVYKKHNYHYDCLNSDQNSAGQTKDETSRCLVSRCSGCGFKITDTQALVALDAHWHVHCFKCHHCDSPLHGEYVAKDGKAYCERDYQRLFGVACVYCKRYITGKVLQAGETHHFHPSCARCSKCGDPFTPGEEMYLQGEVTWHPRCSSRPKLDHPIEPSADRQPQGRSFNPSETQSETQELEHKKQVSSYGQKVVDEKDFQCQSKRKRVKKSNQIIIKDPDSSSDSDVDPELQRKEEELSEIANGIGKIFVQTIREREKMRSWKQANLELRNASRYPSADKELSCRLLYDKPTTRASPSDRRVRKPSQDAHELAPYEPIATRHQPVTTKKLVDIQIPSSVRDYKVVPSIRSQPKPGYGLTNGFPKDKPQHLLNQRGNFMSDGQLKNDKTHSDLAPEITVKSYSEKSSAGIPMDAGKSSKTTKIYPYHLLATSNYRLPPDIDRCHLERHLSNEEFEYIFNCDRSFFYQMPEWKRNDLKRLARLF